MIVKSQRPILVETPNSLINTTRSNVKGKTRGGYSTPGSYNYRSGIVKSKSNIRNNADGGYSYFDMNGKPQSSAETKLFHDWLDNNKPGWHPLWSTLKKDEIKGYGVYPFAPATEQAWTKFGPEFVKFGRGMASASLTAFNTAFGNPGTNPNLSVTDPSGNTKKGQFWDKARKIWVKAQESGIFSSLGNLLGGGQQQQQNWQGDPTMQGGGMPQLPIEEKKGEGMSGGTIALIGVGVIAVGALIYFMTKGDAPASAPAK